MNFRPKKQKKNFLTWCVNSVDHFPLPKCRDTPLEFENQSKSYIKEERRKLFFYGTTKEGSELFTACE